MGSECSGTFGLRDSLSKPLYRRVYFTSGKNSENLHNTVIKPLSILMLDFYRRRKHFPE